MANRIKSIYELLNYKGIKSFSTVMLIFLCLISSCAVKKGIQSFFNGVEQTTSNKSPKNYLPNTLHTATICGITEGMDNGLTLIKQQTQPSGMLSMLFFILPGFLFSLKFLVKDRSDLPIPSSLLRWPQISLFLQNRLLLI